MNNQSLKTLSESVCIWAGPGSESSKNSAANGLLKDYPQASCFVCTTANDFKEKLKKYEKAFYIRAMLCFVFPKHPYGHSGLEHWITRYRPFVENEIGNRFINNLPSLNITISTYGDGYMTCIWQSVKPEDIVLYISALETAYSKVSWS